MSGAATGATLRGTEFRSCPVCDVVQPALNLFSTASWQAVFRSMRSWESVRPLRKLGLGSDSQGRMDQITSLPLADENRVNVSDAVSGVSI